MLELAGELDRAFSAEFESRLAQALRHSLVVTLDLHRLTFMDSAGYAVLAAAAASSRPQARLILVGCSGQVQRLLDAVGLPGRVEFGRPDPSPLSADEQTAGNRSWNRRRRGDQARA